MSTLFTVFSLISAAIVGGNITILAAGRGTALTGGSLVLGVVTAIYFASRSHGWVP